MLNIWIRKLIAELLLQIGWLYYVSVGYATMGRRVM